MIVHAYDYSAISLNPSPKYETKMGPESSLSLSFFTACHHTLLHDSNHTLIETTAKKNNHRFLFSCLLKIQD
jgi:hypothetical protein